MSKPTVVITGATGYIGSWCVHLALEAGMKVVATVRDPSNEKKTAILRDMPSAKDNLEFAKFDLLHSTTEDLEAIVKDATYVLHVASPFAVNVKDGEGLIKQAVEGTEKMVQACVNTKKQGSPLKTLVVTSSVVAAGSMGTGPGVHTISEKTWTNLDLNLIPYVRSKTLAEKAAWKLYEDSNPEFAMCTVNPGFVMGPSITKDMGESTETVVNILAGKTWPVIPALNYPTVDVRDVSMMHVECLLADPATVKGRRFLASNGTLSQMQFAEYLRPFAKKFGYEKNLPMGEIPDMAVSVGAVFSGFLKQMKAIYGEITNADVTPTKEVLKHEHKYSFERTFEDAAHAVVYNGQLKPLAGYEKPREDWTPLNSEKD